MIIPREYVQRRLCAVRKKLADHSLDALVLLNDETRGWENVYYLSGFKGTSAVVFITSEKAVVTVDSRYITQARQQCCFDVHETRDGVLAAMKRFLKGVSRVAFDAGTLSAHNYIFLQNDKQEWYDFSRELGSLRRHKDDWEVCCIKKAAKIATDAYLDTLSSVREGLTELEFCKTLELAVSHHGGEGIWHNSSMIVASGIRSAMPHGVATTKKFKRGDMVTIDFGAIYGEYMSDITRNFTLGVPTHPEFAEIYKVIQTAHDQSAARLKPGMRTNEIHSVAQNIINDAGYGDCFSHALGHSFGLEIHEKPVLSPRSDEILAVGDVVTIEPGIYIPGRGGLRLEDDYLITSDGAECLTANLTQELLLL